MLAGQARPPQPPPGFPDLVGALKSTPGCVGVEVARTGSGKQVIFAWFEDKKAALNWYYSDTHQAAMKQFFPQSEGSKRTPMKDVPDDGGPVMAIASITMADKAPGDITTLPISQIAIELYRPSARRPRARGTLRPVRDQGARAARSVVAGRRRKPSASGKGIYNPPWPASRRPR